MIPMNQCKTGYLYRLCSRHLALGIWIAEGKAFYGIRTKFGTRFLDYEYHWDIGEPYGTARPVEEIEKFPGGDMFAYLEGKEDKCVS